MWRFSGERAHVCVLDAMFILNFRHPISSTLPPILDTTTASGSRSRSPLGYYLYTTRCALVCVSMMARTNISLSLRSSVRALISLPMTRGSLFHWNASVIVRRSRFSKLRLPLWRLRENLEDGSVPCPPPPPATRGLAPARAPYYPTSYMQASKNCRMSLSAKGTSAVGERVVTVMDGEAGIYRVFIDLNRNEVEPANAADNRQVVTDVCFFIGRCFGTGRF